jgi:protein-disulfide isomerase
MAAEKQAEPEAPDAPTVTADDHSQGPADAPVTVVMYGSYTSSETREAHATLKRLRQRFADDLRLVFRHRPHAAGEHEERAAFLTQAASEQGRFWEAHDRLLDHSGPLDEPALETIAQQLSLDDIRYESGHPYLSRYRANLDRAVQAGVSGSPELYINGRRHVGSLDESTLQAAIEAAR